MEVRHGPNQIVDRPGDGRSGGGVLVGIVDESLVQPAVDEVLRTGRLALSFWHVQRPVELRAPLAGNLRLQSHAMNSLRAIVDAEHRVSLRLRQAARFVAVVRANKGVRVELAIPRIVDDAVENAVQPVARGDYFRMDIGQVAL